MSTKVRRSKEELKEARLAKQKALTMKPAVFNEHINSIVIAHKTLMKLKDKMSKAPKGHILVLPGVTDKQWLQARPSLAGEVGINKKFMRDLEKGFVVVLKQMKDFFRVAKKRPSSAGGSSPESYKGPFGPALLSDAFTTFIKNNPGMFGVGQNGQPLVNTLPGLLAGQVTLASITNLLFIYFYANGLQNPEHGDLFDLGPLGDFLAQTPALYDYQEYDSGKGMKTRKIANEQQRTTVQILSGLTQKRIKKGKNSDGSDKFETVSFDPHRMKIFYIKNLIALNSYSKSSLNPDNLEVLMSEQVKQQLIAEHAAIAAYKDAYKGATETKAKPVRPKVKRITSPVPAYPMQ